MNMDHTGEPGGHIENEVEVEVEADVEIELVAEVADDEELALEAGEVEPIELEDAAEHEYDAEDLDEDEQPVGEAHAEPRHRHPAGAAAIAKRVAMDRSARIAVGSLVLVAMMFLFVFPTRSYLAQQRQVRDARHSVQVLRAQNAKLASEAQRLQTKSEIEKLARSQFNMVFEGEEAYNVVPPGGSATTTTTTP